MIRHMGLSAAVFGDEAEALVVARQLIAGAVSINDGALTTEVFDVDKNAFRLSGLGASRLGASGLLRFMRKKALPFNGVKRKDMHASEEATLRMPCRSAFGRDCCSIIAPEGSHRRRSHEALHRRRCC